MGVMWIETLQEMPMELMEQVLGAKWCCIWKKASGMIIRPIEPYSEQKSMSTEQTFERDN